jgi:CBS domain containing-hemolysin-like protein
LDVEGLDHDAIHVMTNVIASSQVPISEICTSIKKVEKFNLDTRIDNETIEQVLELGFSRIPVNYSKNH